jgi:IclR family mhp operon transcriptional activator
MAAPQAAESNDYSTVQGLVRGLEVMVALNRMPGAAASATQLSASTRLHRTTVKRLLETLKAAGFVTYVEENNSYRIAARVQQLSEGYRPEAGVCAFARPLLRDLTERLLWPCSLLTRDGDRLVVRESTHQQSPLSFHSGVMGARLPLVRTAAGRTYLAFCGEEERELLLQMLRERDDDEGVFARDQRTVRRHLEAIRERGFALNEGNDWIGRGRYGAIAVPIRSKHGVAGCLDLIFSKRAVKVEEAAKKYAPGLLATAAAIEVQTQGVTSH